MIPNQQYFVVSIDKEQQKAKRESIVLGGSGYLGIKHSEQDYKGRGVMIVGSEPGSPAYQAGLKEKDIILSVNDQEVDSFEVLAEIVSNYLPGEEIQLRVVNSLLQSNTSQLKKIVLGKKEITLETPEHLRDMRHNLQFGEIVGIGTRAAKEFPHAKLGNILIFHHAVEYKPRTDGDALYNDFHLIGHDEAGNELRLVNCDFEVFGVLNVEDKVIVPAPKWIFCHAHIQKATVQKDGKTGLWLPDKWERSMEENTASLEELSQRVAEISSSTVLSERTTDKNYKEKEYILSVINALNKERKTISKKMNQVKLVEVTVLYFNEETGNILGYNLAAGDKVLCDFHSLYPLDIMGVRFSLARVESIDGAILQHAQEPLYINQSLLNSENMNQFKPLGHRIIVLPHEPETITETGIIIPDVAQTRPGIGEIIACGPGTKDLLMQAKEGDVILYNKFDYTEVEYDGKMFLFMKENDILTTLTVEEAAIATANNEKVKERKLQEQIKLENKKVGEGIQSN